MANTGYEEFKKLEAQILSTPGLNENEAVKQSLDEINAVYDKDKKSNYFDTTTDVFKAIGSGIGKFTKKDANGADIASGILVISSAVFKMLGLIPGAKVITGPLSMAFKLFGSIAGYFGSSKTSRYYLALETMVNDAVDRVNSEQTVENLNGAMNEIQERQGKIAHLLSLKYTNAPEQLSIYNNEITTDYFSGAGEFELGAAYDNISKNIGKSHRGNWARTAGTFYSICELVSYKHLFLLQGIAYFQLAETDRSESSKNATVTFSTSAFMKKYYDKSLPYFERPSLRTAAITHYIYRLTESSFNFIALLCDTLSEGSATYWPEKASNYEFGCSISGKHDAGGGPKCIKLTTLFAHRESNSDKNRVLKNPFGVKSNRENIEGGHSIGIPEFVSKKDAAGYKQFTHFEIKKLLNGKADKPPYYNWSLSAQNQHSEFYIDRSHSPAGKHRYKSFTFSDQGYIFRVFPTDDELTSGKGHWEAEWHKKPEKGRTYIMIGSRGGKEDEVWATKHKKNTGSEDHFEKKSYFDIVYNDHDTYGCPDHCLWYLMKEDEW